MRHPGSTRPAAGVALVLLLVAGACSPSAAAPTTAPSAAPTTAPTTPPTPAATAAASTAPATTPSATTAAATVLDTASLGDAFPLKMRMTIPDGWFTLLPPSFNVPGGTFNVLYGDPNGDPNRWLGPGFVLVDGAKVRDPAKDRVNGTSDLVPWPASYLDYLSTLHGVEVIDGPSPVMVGGQAGRQITVSTPAMAPTIWLKDDSAMLGGGASGIDPAMSRYLVELNVKGTPLLIEYDDGSTRFETKLQDVKALLASIVFEG